MSGWDDGSTNNNKEKVQEKIQIWLPTCLFKFFIVEKKYKKYHFCHFLVFV